MLAVDSRGIEIAYKTSSSAASQRCRVEIDPPLKDPGEGRTRLIDMYHEALEGLGYVSL